MAVSSFPSPFNPDTLDRLFERLPRSWQGSVIPAELYDGCPPARPLDNLLPHATGFPLSYQGPQLPPALDQTGDVQAAYQWLQTEKERLEAYTRAQLEFLLQKHQEDVQTHYRNEATLVMRAQEVNRELQFLATQSAALQTRTRELAEWEAALTAQMDKVHRAQEEFLNIQKNSLDLQKDTQAQRGTLEQLRQETAAIQASRTAAHAEYETMERTLREHRQSWETKQAEMTARQAALERRYRALDEAEAVTRRRQAELDDLERRLLHELDTQQCQLARERQEIDALYARLRAQGESGPARPTEPVLTAAAKTQREALSGAGANRTRRGC